MSTPPDVPGITFEDGHYGLRAEVTTAYSSVVLEALLGHPIVELELNIGKGWRGTDINFLARFPQLELLELQSVHFDSLEPIHILHGLRRLGIYTNCKSEIRFSAFPQLQDCSLQWRKRAMSVFSCTTLQRFAVIKYDRHDVDDFGKLADLTDLQILGGPVRNVHGLSTLKKLRTLRLGDLRQLTSLDGLETCVNLEELTINTCRKVNSIELVRLLKKLRNFYFQNNLEFDSIKPLENLPELRRVILDGSLAADQDQMSPALAMKVV